MELEAATNDINAQLAENRAKEKRAFVDQLNREADDIDANIVKEEATDEYKALTGQEKYEADKEKDDAKKIAANKRQQAEQEATTKTRMRARRQQNISATWRTTAA